MPGRPLQSRRLDLEGWRSPPCARASIGPETPSIQTPVQNVRRRQAAALTARTSGTLTLNPRSGCWFSELPGKARARRAIRRGDRRLECDCQMDRENRSEMEELI